MQPYEFPTNPAGKFARALSNIARSPAKGAKGHVPSYENSQSTFNEQVSQALAIKLNLKTIQHANERALEKLVKETRSGGLKQTLQARAAIYNNVLDPAWFCKSYDLSSKLKTMKERRQARALLAGAPVLTTQLGLNEIQMTLAEGDDHALESFRVHTVGTAAQFTKMLSRATPAGMLKLIKPQVWATLTTGLKRMEESLEFTQSLLNLIGEKPALNPVMNAVADSFFRRRFSGHFQSGYHGIELDTLLNAPSASLLDDDTKVSQGRNRGWNGKRRVCYLFQSGSCTYKACRFNYVCTVCKSLKHGRHKCPHKERTTAGSTERSRHGGTEDHQRPPHPRFRRDRARSLPS